MEENQKVFLQILKSALEGESFSFSGHRQTPSSEQWMDIFQMAQRHKLLPLVYEATYAIVPCLHPEQFPAITSIKKLVIQQVLVQTIKTEEFLKLNQQLQAQGIYPLVVKGIICRDLYHKPDHRLSGDEDLWICGDLFCRYQEAMQQLGMETTLDSQEMEEACEITYTHKDSPLYIELHKRLFADDNSFEHKLNELFRDAYSQSVCQTIQGVKVHTLNPTDHLSYLLCHALKHFLHSGFGIRQVCDIVLFANQYGNQIQWQIVMDRMQSTRGERFAVAVFKIGAKYLNFHAQEAWYPKSWRDMDVEEMPLLTDILQAGVYGGATRSRKHSSHITLEAVKESDEKRHTSTRKVIFKTVFPNRKEMQNRFPFLKRYPYLLPIAWMRRIVTYGIELYKKDDNSVKEAISIGKNRVELLKIYEIIPEHL